MSHSVLKGKKIVVGVTGGIAAFKSATLVRLLVKAGAEVKVIMTPAAKEFITPLTLATLSRNAVISEFFTANTGEWHSHVDLGVWADCMIIAPATASTIGKMAHGIADNILVTAYLSARSQVFVAPSMDLDMMNHCSTVANLQTLESYGNIIIEPTSGELASGLIGKGRMAEPETILECVEEWFLSNSSLQGKKVLITAGPTHEKIDPVRFIGNYSSGKMGYALAEAASAMGALVTLVSGPVSMEPHGTDIGLIRVTNAVEMFEASKKVFADSDIAIMTAAVSDYRPESCAEKKIKREGVEELNLRLVRNPDIAASLGHEKKSGQILVGFALETDDERVNAIKKLEKKNLDYIVLNSLNDAGAGFGTDTNKAIVIGRTGEEVDLPLMSKKQMAVEILKLIAAKIK